MKTYRIFVSSKMKEFLTIRKKLHDELPKFSTQFYTVEAFVYEEDAEAAADRSIQDVYLKKLESCDLYLGIFGEEYGKYTVEEHDFAFEHGLDRLLLIRANATLRETELDTFLKRVVDVESRPAPQYFNTDDELMNHATNSLKKWLAEKGTRRAGSLTATFAKHRDDLPQQPPRKLIGRDDLIAQIKPLLEDGERVLLRGFGGMGKTALAGTLASQFLEENGGVIVWQKMGSMTTNAIFEAIARHQNAHLQMAQTHLPEEKRNLLREILRGVGLIILDDAWEGKPLHDTLQAIPRSIPVLITSRHAYPVDSLINVGELAPSDAVALLGYYAGREDYSVDPAATELCRILGYHAYGVEIAGKIIKTSADANNRKMSPQDLLNEYRTRPHALTMPAEFAEEGYESLAKMLELSLHRLDADTQKLFMAMGAFFDGQYTAELLAWYFVEIPSVTDKLMAEVRENNPHLAEISDDDLRKAIYQQIIWPNITLSIPQIEAGLNTLIEKGLLDILRGENLHTYRLHDIAFSYAHELANEDEQRRALVACFNYTQVHAKPNLANFAVLHPVIDNLLGAADFALLVNELKQVREFAKLLYAAGGWGGFLLLQGLYTQAIHLLEQSLMASHLAGNQQAEGAWLGNLGNTYSDLGQYHTAIQYHKQALTISRQISDLRGEGQDLGNLGNAYYSLGEYHTAIEYHEQSLQIKRKIGDLRGEGNSLGSLGNAYADLGEYITAIEYYEQALDIQRKIDDLRGEGNSLGNLGNAYSDLGQCHTAIEYYEQALDISRKIGDRLAESHDLNNLGVVYEKLEGYPRALEYLEQALNLRRTLGVPHHITQTERNIKIVKAKIAGGSSE